MEDLVIQICTVGYDTGAKNESAGLDLVGSPGISECVPL